MTLKRIAPVMLIALALGCSQSGKGQRELTAKEKGYQNWNSTRAGVLYSLARQNYEVGNFDVARKAIDDAIKLDAKGVQIRLLSAKLHIEQGRMVLAQKDLDEARTTDPKNAEAEYLAGVIFQRWQKPQQAFECYSRASEKDASELAYLLAKAEMLVQLDRPQEALSALQDRMTYFENSGAIRDAVGQLMVQQGRYAEAATVLRQASILSPDEALTREHLALAYYYAKDYREAGKLLARLLKDEKFAQRSDLLTALGECQLEAGAFRDARDSFESAATLDPGSTTVWLGFAKAAMQLEDTKRVELSLRKAGSLEPGNPEVQLMQGYLRLRQDRFEEALLAFRKASALDEKDPVSLCMTGYTLEKLGRNHEAIPYYAKALKLKPGDELAATLMASVRDE